MATIVCDVNETLLDLSALDEPFAEHFADRAGEVKRLWFARLLHLSSVMTQLGTWQDFAVVGRSVLVDVSERLGLTIGDDAAGELVGEMRRLPPHDDVADGLSALRRGGHSVTALTNSGQATAEAQLAGAGLSELLDAIISVDTTLRFKPDPAVYEHAEHVLGTAPAGLILIAAHDWDCAGAMRCGWRAGFLARPGTAYSRLLQPPTYRGEDLVALAEQIGSADT